MAEHSFHLRGSNAVTGYQYACLEDATNGGIFAYSNQFCLQQIVLEYPSGTSDGTLTADDGFTYGWRTFAASGTVDTIGFEWSETCGVQQSLYVCTATPPLPLVNPCSEYMAKGLCFETVHTNPESESGEAGTDSFSIPATDLEYYTGTGGADAGGSTATWNGYLYFCVEDFNAIKEDTTVPSGVATISDAFDWYIGEMFCIQYLVFTAISHSPSDGTNTADDGTTYSFITYANSGSSVDTFTEPLPLDNFCI